MPFLLIGVLTLLLCIYLLRQLGRASPEQVAANIRLGGGFLSALIALLVLVRGRLALALGFGGLSLFLFSGDKISKSKFARQARRKAKQSSHVQTAYLDMFLDHASGDVDGSVLEGEFSGAALSELSREQLERLRRECSTRDRDSVLLLDNYFDRRFPGWRAAGEGDAHTGGNRAWRSRGGEMTEQEAYQTLGLKPGASADDIVRAHRRLMKERHPDHGGTTDDAARLNQAKDRLMRRQG